MARSGPLERARYRYAQARDDYILVFFLIFVVIVLYSVVPVLGVGGLIVTAVQTVTLLLALHTSGVRGRPLAVVRWLSLLPVLAVLVGTLLPYLSVWMYFPAMILLILATQVAVILHEVRSRTVTVDTVVGALCVYLLIGLLFATADSFYAQAVGPFFAQTSSREVGDYVYYSFVTLCTVGYGDLTPGPPVARLLAIVEALLGQLYLVTVIAIIVGALGSQRVRRGSKDDE